MLREMGMVVMRDTGRKPVATHTRTHTHTAYIAEHRSPGLAAEADPDPVARLRALGLRPGPAAFVARFAALGFPDYQVLAADQGISYEAVCSRLYRARKSLEAKNPRQFIALVLRVLGVAGDPGVAIFSRIAPTGVQTRR
jgi:hypothetical protein